MCKLCSHERARGRARLAGVIAAARWLTDDESVGASPAEPARPGAMLTGEGGRVTNNNEATARTREGDVDTTCI